MGTFLNWERLKTVKGEVGSQLFHIFFSLILQVGNLILTHRNNAVTGPMDKRREMIKQNEADIGMYLGMLFCSVLRGFTILCFIIHCSSLLSNIIICHKRGPFFI